MANINFNDLTPKGEGNGDYPVGFFSLKNGEEAIVRIYIDSLDDFDLYTVHPITVGQASFANRRVNCLRNNPKTDPINMCPLCAKGEKVQQRIYIKMLQYVNENGKIVPKAVIWDRPASSYAVQLKSYLDGYGPLSNILCKIVRQGDGLETKYTIMPNLNPAQYNESMYPKDFSAFNNYTVLGGPVMNKTYEEINQFIVTGNFPTVENTQSVATPNVAPVPTQPQQNPIPNAMPASTAQTDEYGLPDIPDPLTAPPATFDPSVPFDTGVPGVPEQATMVRPTRYY